MRKIKQDGGCENPIEMQIATVAARKMFQPGAAGFKDNIKLDYMFQNKNLKMII